MRLVADDAIHDVCACLLQTRRELDVGRFVESSHQFDDDRDFLAGACRIHQRIDDR